MQQQRAVALALGLLCSSCCLVGEAGASGWLGARASASRRGLPLHAGGGALGGSSSSSSSSCCSSRASTSERRRRARARAGAGIYAGRGEAASWRSSCSSAGPTIYALTGGGGGEDKQRRESPLLVALASTDSSTAGSGDGSRASREVLPRKLVDEEDQAITTMSTEGLAVMMVLCFLVALICALDRVAMSVAIIPMAGEYGYSPSTQGLIGSVFSWGYMCSMIPVGILGSFLSPKAVMAGGVLIWSVAQILSPLGAAAGLPWLLSFRFAMGAAEAVTVPLIQEIVGQIVPVSQKGRWLALILSGLQVGTVLAYVASPAVISAFEWPGLFEVYGAAGLVWIGLWLAFARDVPNQNRAMPLAVSEIELETLPRDLKNMEQKVTKSSRGLNFTTLLESLRDVPWAEIVRDKNICCIAAAHMAHNYGLYIILFYLPTFFSECGLSLSQSSGASVMPWIAGAVVGNAAGWAADGLINSGALSTSTTRRIFQTIALLGPAACLWVLSSSVGDADVAERLFTLAVALGSCSSAGFGASVQDLQSKYVSIIYSLTSAVSVACGSAGTYLTGILLENTHNFAYAFQMTSLVYVVGAVIYASSYEAKRFRV